MILLPVSRSLAQGTTGICEHLQSTGRVTVQQPQRLYDLLTRQPKIYYAGRNNTPREDGRIVTQGFRVRAFSGNQQQVSKMEAQKIEKELKEFMPELETYLIFKTPNWRLMVGNYRTSEEAQALLRTLKQKFPVYGREMFVVKDEIEL